MEVGSLKAFFGNDRLDLTLGGKLGGLGIQWIVRAHPTLMTVHVGYCCLGGGSNCLLATTVAAACSASLSHDVVLFVECKGSSIDSFDNGE